MDLPEIYVGAIVTANLALSLRNARRIGQDSMARTMAVGAHERIDAFLQGDYDDS